MDFTDATISVESTCEWQIHDILYDGQERYLQPLVFSDHVAKLAHKVNWKQICQRTQEELKQKSSAPTSSASEICLAVESGEKSGAKAKSTATTAQPSAGPWEKVAKYLTQSMVELNVLSDVLLIAHNKKYLTLEQIHLDKEEFNKSLCFVGKKKALFVAAKCLTNLAERINVEKKSKVALGAAHYQNELLELRKLWKLKKVGTNILGDLSYKSFGSKFRPCATFEVKKRNLDEVGGSGENSLQITLPKEVKETRHISIEVEKDGNPVISTRFSSLNTSTSSTNAPWQKQLIAAQFTLLSKDLYAQLAKESFHLSHLACNVKDSSISILLHPDTALHIRLESDDKLDERKSVGLNSAKCFVEDAIYKLFCTELDSVEGEIPRPVSGPLGLRKKLRLAGSLATSTDDIQTYTKQNDQLLLEKLINFVKHFCLVEQIKKALNSLKETSSDPAVSYHLCAMNELTETSLRVTIFSPGLDMGLGSKISFTVDVGVEDMRLTFREGDEATLSASPTELIYLIKRQMIEHQINNFWQLAKSHGFNCLSLNVFTLTDDAKPCPSACVATPDGLKSLVVRCPMDGSPTVLVQTRTKAQEGFRSDLIPAEPWGLLRGNYDAVDYERLVGRSFLQKMEFLMQMLSSS